MSLAPKGAGLFCGLGPLLSVSYNHLKVTKFPGSECYKIFVMYDIGRHLKFAFAISAPINAIPNCISNEFRGDPLRLSPGPLKEFFLKRSNRLNHSPNECEECSSDKESNPENNRNCDGDKENELGTHNRCPPNIRIDIYGISGGFIVSL